MIPTMPGKALLGGNVVFFRRRWSEDPSAAKLVDYTFDCYDSVYGIFGVFCMFPTHGLSYVVGRNEEGQRAAALFMDTFDKMAKGTITEEDHRRLLDLENSGVLTAKEQLKASRNGKVRK
jgi:hypothetical protein